MGWNLRLKTYRIRLTERFGSSRSDEGLRVAVRAGFVSFRMPISGSSRTCQTAVPLSRRFDFSEMDYIGGSYRPKPQKPSEGLANPPGHLAVIIVSSKTSMKFGLSIELHDKETYRRLRDTNPGLKV